jgi:hypothetical protein
VVEDGSDFVTAAGAADEREAAMQANPGGLLEVNEIYGRDDLIAELWRALEWQSVRLEGEKRIGKSSILRKMAVKPPAGWMAVSLSLLNVHSAEEFAEGIYRALAPHQTRWKKFSTVLGDFFNAVGGIEVGGLFKLPEGQPLPKNYWKNLLQTTVKALVTAKGNEKVVFLFDEMTLMLQNVAQQQGEATAMEVLDVLSHLRKSYGTGQGFRMVLTGSIGMPHILSSLKEKGYADQGVSAMLLYEVPPLADVHAIRLARDLITGEKLSVSAPDESAKAIASEAENVPFYVHWIVHTLVQKKRTAEPDAVKATVAELLADPLDRLELRHFHTRINHYYKGNVPAVLTILDHVASRQTATFAEIIDEVRKRVPNADDETIRELLRLLMLDHYLIRDGYRFAFMSSLLLRWWKVNRLL